MATVEFHIDHLNREIAGSSEGDAFQRFAFDLLQHEYPQLHLFPTSGKDGAIDLSQTDDSCRVVGETKKIGDDDALNGAQREWKEVSKHLQQHLADPSGPTKGQSQYRPWYRVDIPITEYLFCISGRLANQNQRDLLHDEIKRCFTNLASDHAHLKHLSKITVRVLDWSEFETRLSQQPHLKFRWFPKTRPVGLTPIDSLPKGTGFRAYLNEDHLPYYSRAAFRGSPEGARFRDEIQDEMTLLSMLSDSGKTGLVLTGSGGVGKTRLGFEMGRLALANGWTVLVVGNTMREEALTSLAENCPPDARILLVFDYVETQRGFIELANRLTDLSNQCGLHLHFVANCRSSYYHELEGTVDHTRVDLVPSSPTENGDWTGPYRQAVIRHILSGRVPHADEQHFDLCRNLPVFAVFMCYLVERNREPWLQELVQEQDFGQWIAKRIQQTLGGVSINHDLALLMGLLPVPREKLANIRAKFGRLIDPLATDEWISQLPDAEQTWATAHDVFADRILLSYLDRIRATAESFVDELLDLGETHGLLRSAFMSLQRIADQAIIAGLPWPKIIEQRLTQKPELWQPVCDLVTRTPLLKESELLTLLGSVSRIWDGAEADTGLQNAIGWLARWAARDENRTKLSTVQQSTLTEWLRRSAPHAYRSNYVLTYGLKWDRELMRADSLRWLVARPDLFQTHFLLVAWLVVKLPTDEVRTIVESWLSKYAKVSHVSFVVQSWLYAGGDKSVVEAPIRAWLAQHQADSEAQFVYKSWLDAGGDKSVVEAPIRAWLAQHQAESEAEFVYKSWLDAGGDQSVVEAPIRAWLAQHQADSEASHVYKSWLDAGGHKSVVEAPIRAWLAQHQADSDAQFVYNSWLDAGGDQSVVDAPIRAWLAQHQADNDASYVYKSWLDAGGDKRVVDAPIRAWLAQHQADSEAQFVFKSWLDAGGDKSVVEAPIRAWLAQHQADNDASYVYKSWLDAGGDKRVVDAPIRAWLALYENTLDSQAVMKAWLLAGGEKDVIQRSLCEWQKVHATASDAGYLYSAWLESGGEFELVSKSAAAWLSIYRDQDHAVFLTGYLAKEATINSDTICDILFWCSTFALNPDALWRMTNLREKLFRKEVALQVVDTAEKLLKAHAPHVQPSTTASKQFDWISSYLISGRAMHSGELRSRVDVWVVQWIKHAASFTNAPHASLQRSSTVQRLSDLLYSGKLDVRKDEQALAKFLRWLNRWDGEKKAEVRHQLDELSAAFPGSKFWNCIDFL